MNNDKVFDEALKILAERNALLRKVSELERQLAAVRRLCHQRRAMNEDMSAEEIYLTIGEG